MKIYEVEFILTGRSRPDLAVVMATSTKGCEFFVKTKYNKGRKLQYFRIISTNLKTVQ